MTELHCNVIRAFNFKLLIEWTDFDLYPTIKLTIKAKE